MGHLAPLDIGRSAMTGSDFRNMTHNAHRLSYTFALLLSSTFPYLRTQRSWPRTLPSIQALKWVGIGIAHSQVLLRLSCEVTGVFRPALCLDREPAARLHDLSGAASTKSAPSPSRCNCRGFGMSQHCYSQSRLAHYSSQVGPCIPPFGVFE